MATMKNILDLSGYTDEQLDGLVRETYQALNEDNSIDERIKAEMSELITDLEYEQIARRHEQD